MARWVDAGSASELWAGELRGLVAHDSAGGSARARLLVLNVDGELHAFEDRCAHLGLRLSGGTLEGHVLTCPAHGWQYDARSGAGINPKSAALSALPVCVRAGTLWVDVERCGHKPKDDAR